MFGILGATRVVGADGAEIALGGPRRRALLALLMLDAGRMVSTERLIDGLYGAQVPAGVANAVQSQVSRLRQVLPVPLEGQLAGYRLAVDPDDVDAHRFQRLSARGREALAAGDPARAAELLRDALALWRGPALVDVGDAPFAGPQTVRLEELRIGAVEDQVEADLALGRHRALVADLGEMVAERPLRERLRGQYMRALYGSGRQSEALAAYEDARRELAESLGADPGPELAAVHLSVLRGAPEPLPPAPDVPRGTSPDPQSGPEPDGAVYPGPGSAPGTGPAPEVQPRSWSGRQPGAGAGTVREGGERGGAGSTWDRGAPGEGLAPDARPGGVRTGAAAGRQEAAAGPRYQMPAPLTSFVGRDAELGRICGQLERERLVTLIGPGGAGKTRLAIEAARRHQQDACFIELVGITGGAELPQAVLDALGLRDGGLRSGVPGGPAAAPDPFDRIAAALDGRPLLLVLDNCEHVVADAAALAERLLAASPRLRILATSREALGIGGEALCPIPTLDVPEPGTGRAQVLASPAVRLFTERAAAVRPDFDPAADVDSVLRLCTALDGLPLAIELAAARLRSLSVSEIAARLGSTPDCDDAPYSAGVRPDTLFRLLSRGSRTAQPRQRTLRGVVEWSWQLLPADERAVLRRASVFAGGWTLAAAEAVCADPAQDPDEILDLIAALVEKSLVVAEHPDGAGRVRYRMLESIRAYGAEQLAAAGETEASLRAHAAYFLDFALRADPHLRRAEQLDWLRLLSDERDNLQAALHRALAAGDFRTAMRLIAALSLYWLLRGVRNEGVEPARQVLAHLGPYPPEDLEEEYALSVLAVVGTLSDPADYAEHVAAASRVVDGMNRLGRRFPALTLLWAPFAGLPEGDLDATTTLEAFLAVAGDDPWYRALAHLGLGFQSWILHADPGRAQRECEASLAEFQVAGDRWGMITCLNVLADLADYRGELPRAAELLGAALDMAEELDSALDMAELLGNRAAYRLRAGDYDSAVADCERAVTLARRAGSPEMLAVAHTRLGEAARLRGDLAGSRALCEQALAECPTGWFSSNSARSTVLVALGQLAVAEGDAAAAREHFREAVTADIAAMRLPMAGSLAAEAAAELAFLEGDPRQAATLMGAARAMHGSSLSGAGAARIATASRAALGDEPYEAAFRLAAAYDRDTALETLSAYVSKGPPAAGG